MDKINTRIRISYYLLLITFLFWWSGLAGASLYALPALISLVYFSYLIYTGTFSQVLEGMISALNGWLESPKNRRLLLIIFIAQGAIWLLYIIVKYYSFSLFTLDAGYHSNILFNISNGEFYSSVFNMHNLGEHFTLSMSFIALFYKLVPSINWMMGFKWLAFAASGPLIYLTCMECVSDRKKARITVVVLLLYWFFLYKPIINSVRYEFQGSCLSLPFILYAFYCLRKEQWVRFLLSMVFLLGFKEHLGAVWIGFGCYLVANKPKKVLGYLLILGGILAIYIIMFQVKPYFRGPVESYNDVNMIAPFRDLHLKARYFFIFLLLPLFFIPIIYWRNGLIAGPAIGINLISGYETMYTSHYHYDDVPSTLLIIAVVASIDRIDFKALIQFIKSNRIAKPLLLVWFFLFVYYLPYSNLRFIKKVLPDPVHLEVRQEIHHFNASVEDDVVAAQDVLGPHIYRRNFQPFYQGKSCLEGNIFYKGSITLPDYQYLVLAPGVDHYGIRDMQQCIRDMDGSPEFTRIDTYKHLIVYKRTGS